MSVAQSRVSIENDEFKERLIRGILADEDYSELYAKLQDPQQTNEVTERSRKFIIKRGILKLHEEQQPTTYEYWRTVLPNDTEIKKTVLKELHCVPYAGHPGFARTLEVVRTSFYWKHMNQDVRAFVVDCSVCQMEKSSHLQPAGRLMPLSLPTRKWEHVVVAVPTGPHYLQDLSLSRGGRPPVLLACPPCCWPLTGLRAASRCRHLQVASRGCRAHESVCVGVRCARVDPHFNRLSARPAADAACT